LIVDVLARIAADHGTTSTIDDRQFNILLPRLTDLVLTTVASYYNFALPVD
jgi:hypothetical protein